MSLTLTAILVVIALMRLYATLTITFASDHMVDYNGYMAATQRWLDTGTPYNAWEVAGPFDYGPHTFLHPPVAVLFFLPFLYLPPILWWVLPIALVIWSFNVWRPVWWSWPVMAAMVAVASPAAALTTGNTNIWVCAGVAFGLLYGWPAVLIFLKPSLFPLAFIGSWSKWWWIGVVILLLASVPFGALWFDWARVLLNSPGTLLYSANDIPWILVPIVAWYAATRPRPTWSHRAMRPGKT